MGNYPCFSAGPTATTSTTSAKLVLWGGSTRILPDQQIAGEIMFQFPDCIVCPANAFFIGKPVPALTIEDELHAGETYFVIPSDRLPCGALTAASLALLSPSKGQQKMQAPQTTLCTGKCPFEYVKGDNGKAYIRVLPEFIEGMISGGGQKDDGGSEENGGGSLCDEICSTPELRKHYEQLVGSRNRPWSPRLETITETNYKVRLLSSRRFLICDIGSHVQ